MVSQSVVIALYVTLTIFISFPILLLVIYKIRTKASIIPYFVGAIVYFTFGMLGESFCHSIFLGDQYPMGAVINGNGVLYVLYHAIVSAAFEVFGIWFAYRAIMKNYNKRESGAVFGIGFAGMEALMLEGISMFTNIFFVSMLNEEGIEGFKASFADVGATQAVDMSEVEELIETLQSFTVYDVVMSVLERLIYFLLQLSICVIVYYAAKKNVKSMLWAALIARAVCAVPSATATYIGSSNVFVGLAILAVLSITVFTAGLKLHKEFDNPVLITDVRQLYSFKS